MSTPKQLTPPRTSQQSLSFTAFAGIAGIVVALLSLPQAASALSMEQANANCRETVGRPIVQACMQEMRGSGDKESNLVKCRAKASPTVRACTLAAMNKANARANVAISIDDGKTKKEVINLGNALPAGFVPPPRSIADIAAVLDNEKPDPATLAKLKDDADDEPDPKQSVSDLAEFVLRARDRTPASRAVCGSGCGRGEGTGHRVQRRRSDAEAANPAVRRACRKSSLAI